MSVLDIIIMTLIAAWAAVALASVFGRRSGGCYGSGGCSGCCSACGRKEKKKCRKCAENEKKNTSAL